MSLGCVWIVTEEKDWKTKLEETSHIKSNEDQKLQTVYKWLTQYDSSDIKSQSGAQSHLQNEWAHLFFKQESENGTSAFLHLEA